MTHDENVFRQTMGEERRWITANGLLYALERYKKVNWSFEDIWEEMETTDELCKNCDSQLSLKKGSIL